MQKVLPDNLRILTWLTCLALLGGCAGQARQLMPMPNLYAGPEAPELFADLPEDLRSNRIDLLYLTDRQPETRSDGSLNYGFARSRSLGFGSAVVTINPGMPWEELEQVSLERKRSKRLVMELSSIEELGRFPPTPPELVVVDGQTRVDPAALEVAAQTGEALQSEILRRLELAPANEVVVFVHGFNNDFDDAAFTLAELWHYLGREQVPILYTWPAGRGGPAGYIYDRESGEFTIHHLKSVFRFLHSIPEIDTFHLIAHSRGTDVLSSAIRELAIEARASGAAWPAKFRGSHIILAAPDLDMDVVSQRIVAEQLGRETRNISIYTSRSDKAIGLAEHFFKSVKRIGRLGAEDMPETGASSMPNIEGLSFIELEEVQSAGSSHGYFHSDPSASSDLILMIRYGREPGAEHGRPLKPVAAGFWQIEPGYPYTLGDGD